jgi:hypothetical protein
MWAPTPFGFSVDYLFFYSTIKSNNMKKNLLIIIAGILMLSSAGLNAQKPGLNTDGRHLYTPAGEKLILKGFNAMIVYWDIHGEINFPQVEKTGANCVRIFWKLSDPRPAPGDLDKVLENCIRRSVYGGGPIATPVLRTLPGNMVTGQTSLGGKVFRLSTGTA